MLLKSLLIIAAVLVGFAILILTRSEHFHVSRTATINAPAAKVFEQVNTIINWNNWSPWARLDPNATSTLSGPQSGTGATMQWSGNSDVGQGTMTITESRANEAVVFRLDFIKPMQATNTATFTFQPQGGQTVVTWSMDGTNGFLGKAIGLFMDCEKMVGKQFEQGLANLKALVEVPAAANVSPTAPAIN